MDPLRVAWSFLSFCSLTAGVDIGICYDPDKGRGTYHTNNREQFKKRKSFAF